MAEYIEREAAKEAVKYIPWCDWKAVCDCLDELPAADVVPVVRCKDCEHSDKIRKWNGVEYLGCCRNYCDIYEVYPNHFCGYGKRRDSDGFVEVNNYEQKCPCGLRDYMEEEDCSKTKCNDCCPLTKGECDG